MFLPELGSGPFLPVVSSFLPVFFMRQILPVKAQHSTISSRSLRKPSFLFQLEVSSVPQRCLPWTLNASKLALKLHIVPPYTHPQHKPNECLLWTAASTVINEPQSWPSITSLSGSCCLASLISLGDPPVISSGCGNQKVYRPVKCSLRGKSPPFESYWSRD